MAENNSLLGAGLVAGAGLLGQGINAMSQGSMNRKTREFLKQRYVQELTDRDIRWHGENLYNSPVEQMKRLKAAGLNPNLVYDNGKGAAGASAQISIPETKSWQPHAPQLDTRFVGDAVSAFYDTQVKQAQTDNLKSQADLIAAQKANVETNTVKQLTDIRNTEFDLGVKSDLRDVSLDMQRTMLHKLKTDITKTETDTQYTLDNNQREWIKQENDLKEQVVRMMSLQASMSKIPHEIKEIQARIENIRANTKMTNQDIEMWLNGITRNDPLWARQLKFEIDRIREEKTGDAGKRFGNYKPKK